MAVGRGGHGASATASGGDEQGGSQGDGSGAANSIQPILIAGCWKLRLMMTCFLVLVGIAGPPRKT